jgi:hypothetical protein
MEQLKTMHQQEIEQLQDEMEQTRKDDMESSKKQRDRSYTRERALKEALRTAQVARPSDEVEDVAEIGRLRKAIAAEIEKNRSLSAAQVEDVAEIGRLRKAMAAEMAETQRMRTTLSAFFLDDKDSRVHGVSVGTKAATTAGLVVPTEVAVPTATYLNITPALPSTSTAGRTVKGTTKEGRPFRKAKDYIFKCRVASRRNKGNKSFLSLAKDSMVAYIATSTKQEKKEIRLGVLKTFMNDGGRFFEATKEEGRIEVNLERALYLSDSVFTNLRSAFAKKSTGRTQTARALHDPSPEDETKQTEAFPSPPVNLISPAAYAAIWKNEAECLSADSYNDQSGSDCTYKDDNMDKKPRAKTRPDTHSFYDCPKCDKTFAFPKKYNPPLSSDGKVSDKEQWTLHQSQKNAVRKHMREHKEAFPMEEWPEAYVYKKAHGGGKEYFERMEERKRMAELELTAENKKKQMIELPPSIVI